MHGTHEGAIRIMNFTESAAKPIITNAGIPTPRTELTT
jgi:hypothetical protein